jgi:hypothetical protein
MASRLIQKHLLKGTREFEIVDDVVNVRIKSFKNEESLTVMLSVLNPEPVIRKSFLDFTSRVNNEPLLSLYLAKPNAEEFNAFVNLLKQEAQNAYSAFAGLKSGTRSKLKGNVDEEPPAFETSDSPYAIKNKKELAPQRIEEAIRMLSTHIGRQHIEAFISALEALETDPENESHLNRMVDEFEALGRSQGAVLTYAPYIGVLLSDDPYTRS